MTSPQSPNHNAEFEALLNYLKRNRGFDFTGYKRSSLMRRINKRMETIGVEGFTQYIEHLDLHADEFVQLFDTILINVTSFFRDRDTWDYVEAEIIPTIVANKSSGEAIRIWSAACASGEEAYSLAILLIEAVGLERFREQVKIYATDVDEDALNEARQASYSQRDISEIPAHLVEKYFEKTNTDYLFHKDLRRSVIFGRHDLMKDPPIPRIDLLLCRNVLMYFNAESQSRILARFNFALKDTGFLVVGKAEMLYTHNNFFVPFDVKRRVFKKVSHVTLRDRLKNLGQSDTLETVDRLAKHVRLREAALEASPEAQCIVDLNGFMILINERARSLLNLGALDLNRPIQELALYSRIIDFRTHIQEAYIATHPVIMKEVQWTTESGEVHILDIHIVPLLDELNHTSFGISFIFRDLTIYKRLQEKLENTYQELETTNEELHSTNEELETINEELHSTNEELETTNEELHSTNEELETINEELQATNEEMHTINEELRVRSAKLNQINEFLDSILTSIGGGVVVVDPDLHILVWSTKMEDLWGLRNQEVQNKNFLNLDIGLPVEQLRQPIRACLSGESDRMTINLDAINRRGKTIHCKVTTTPLRDHTDSKVNGVILIMEEQEI